MFKKNLILQAVNTVEQTVVIIPEEEKRAFTRYFVDTMKPKDKVIIFVGKKLTYVVETNTNTWHVICVCPLLRTIKYDLFSQTFVQVKCDFFQF